jgi:hypothetical protein
LPFDINGNQIELVTFLTSFGKQSLGFLDIANMGANVGILGMHRTHMMVFGSAAMVIQPERQDCGVVHRPRRRAPYPDIVIRLGGNAEAGNDRGTGRDLGTFQPNRLNLGEAIGGFMSISPDSNAANMGLGSDP